MSAGIVLEYSNVAQYLNEVASALQNPHLMWGEMGEALIDIHRMRFRAQMSPEGERWRELAPWYHAQKRRNKNKILTLNGYLSGTLRYQVQNDGVLFGSNLPYAAIHHFGGVIKPKSGRALNVAGRLVSQVTIPARPWLGLSAADEDRMLSIAQRHLFQINA